MSARDHVTDELGSEDPSSTSEHAFGPSALCDLLLAAPLRFRANLVTLEPAADACQLEMKRGTTTLVSTTIDSEVAVAASIRLARIAGIDPLRISSELDAAGTSRRVRVEMGTSSGEVLVSLAALPNGLRVEARPLSVEIDAPPESAPVSLRRCAQCGALQSAARSECEIDHGKLYDVVERADVGGFLGNYHLESVLGEGGMGRVYLARHGFLGHTAAIKLLHRTMDEDPLAGQRFLAEARVARSIHHPSVVEVLDYGLMSDGRPFMVMELVEGTSLENHLDEQEALAPTRALELAREIALGLAAAHERGAVHLDLKPANVIITSAEEEPATRIKLIDFGASVQLGSIGDEGTPAYMSPEHACGEPTDARSDLYALGVVLFEMLTGAPPFVSSDAHTVLRMHVTEPAPTVTSPHRALPRAVTQLVQRLLEKAPDDRFPSATAFVEQCDAALAILQRKDWLRWLP